eukprot:6456322-Amphidinium_carterae.1
MSEPDRLHQPLSLSGRCACVLEVSDIFIDIPLTEWNLEKAFPLLESCNGAQPALQGASSLRRQDVRHNPQSFLFPIRGKKLPPGYCHRASPKDP